MATAAVLRMTSALPISLRAAVLGYVDAVAGALPEIEKEARARLTSEEKESFLLIVAVRRIWASVNTQFWTMNDCVGIAERQTEYSGEPFRGFRAGRDEISQGSAAVREATRLRDDFQKLIRKHELEHYVADTVPLVDIVRTMKRAF